MLELACFNLNSCQIAQKLKIQRIEFCEDYANGGVTPSQENIIKARQIFENELFVMIRPRGGDFVYSAAELEEMKAQILFCKEQKCDGVVFGILNAENEIDIENCKILAQLAQPMQCTFHRAFDRIENVEQGLEELINIGFQRVLTSGKAKTAMEGVAVLKKIIEQAQGRITILVGGGVRSTNIAELISKTQAQEFHTAAILQGDMVDAGELAKILKIDVQHSLFS